ncbi:hypothetical protein M3Y97_00380900 [Aphelenchoides bicaudatus]|nr:hypothetical protein M3Y97_00380900 [Aphelenchoides bicaudatus]
MSSEPSTSSPLPSPLNMEEEILFRYKWPLRVRKRLMENGDQTLLHVSPPFITAINGVQFTWALKLYDEYVVFDLDENADVDSRRLVNITLYYKDGPAQDIQLTEARFSVDDSHGKRQFSNVALENLEYIKGSGWPCSENSTDRSQLTDFVLDNIGKTIMVIVELKIKLQWFLPFSYLPKADNQLIQLECDKMLDEMLGGDFVVPDMELFDSSTDKYALHRHCFLVGCKEIAKRLSVDVKQIENYFANTYFTRVINEETECFEDYVDLLVASFVVHFPALKRECERFICRELMLETADDAFVKKMLLLAERFNLKVLKMVASGVIIDRFISGNHQKRGSVDEIREELLQIAEQIKTNDDENQHDKEECDKEVLVGSVIDQLEELAKHIRKVSMSPDSGCPLIGVAPVCSSPTPEQIMSMQGRRSSLKTSRELLTFSSSSALGPCNINSPRIDSRRRRSVMFSLPNTLDESSVEEFKNKTETSSTSSNSLSSRVLPDVDELDVSHKESDDFEVEENQVFDDKSPIFTFEESYVRCIPNNPV